MMESQSWSRWIREWVALTLGLLVATQVVSGITYSTTGTLALVVLVLSVLNSVLRPLLTMLLVLVSLPLVVATLGVGLLVVMWLVNALLFYFTSALIDGFEVQTFGDAMWGAFWVSVVSLILNFLLGGRPLVVRNSRRPGPPQTSRRKINSDDDVIDV